MLRTRQSKRGWKRISREGDGAQKGESTILTDELSPPRELTPQRRRTRRTVGTEKAGDRNDEESDSDNMLEDDTSGGSIEKKGKKHRSKRRLQQGEQHKQQKEQEEEGKEEENDDDGDEEDEEDEDSDVDTWSQNSAPAVDKALDPFRYFPRRSGRQKKKPAEERKEEEASNGTQKSDKKKPSSRPTAKKETERKKTEEKHSLDDTDSKVSKGVTNDLKSEVSAYEIGTRVEKLFEEKMIPGVVVGCKDSKYAVKFENKNRELNFTTEEMLSLLVEESEDDKENEDEVEDEDESSSSDDEDAMSDDSNEDEMDTLETKYSGDMCLSPDTPISKDFGGTTFKGKIVGFRPACYKVVYEDNDEEVMEEDNLECYAVTRYHLEVGTPLIMNNKNCKIRDWQAPYYVVKYASGPVEVIHQDYLEAIFGNRKEEEETPRGEHGCRFALGTYIKKSFGGKIYTGEVVHCQPPLYEVLFDDGEKWLYTYEELSSSGNKDDGCKEKVALQITHKGTRDSVPQLKSDQEEDQNSDLKTKIVRATVKTESGVADEKEEADKIISAKKLKGGKPSKRRMPDETDSEEETEFESEFEAPTVEGKCTHCCKSPMIRPVATECCHIFCRSCATDLIRKDSTCPFCENSLGVDGGWLEPSDARFGEVVDSFVPVEKLDPVTGTVLAVYTNASAASQDNSVSPLDVIDFCTVSRPGRNSVGGFYWRFKGSNAIPEKSSLTRRCRGSELTLFEQVDSESNEVIAVFDSVRLASKTTGVSSGTIRRALDNPGIVLAGGYVWRNITTTTNQGEGKKSSTSSGEPTDADDQNGTDTQSQQAKRKPRFSGLKRKRDTEKKDNHQRVEQVVVASGEVIGQFDSIAEAKRVLKIRGDSRDIQCVCEGQRHTAAGFFWRWAGSDKPPSRAPIAKRGVQMLSPDGETIKIEFNSCRDAASHVGVSGSLISQWCREQEEGRGCLWRYFDIECRHQHLCGKRFSVVVNGKQLKGRVVYVDEETGVYSVRYDNQKDVATLHPNKHSIEWDDAKLSVEQVCRKSKAMIKTFNSIKVAAKAVGCKVPQIMAVLNGQANGCKGFFWRHKGSDAVPRDPLRARRVEQLCPETGQSLAQYMSLQEAGKAVKVTASTISAVCKGYKGHLTAGGYRWRFLPDED